MSGEWPPDLGTALVIPSDTENLAVVLYPAAPNTTLDPQTQLALFAVGGEAVRLKVGVSGADSARCGDAPLVHLARPTPILWSMGVASAAARPMRSDSLDALSHEDSLFYSTESARLGSAVLAGTASRLSGLPFTLTAIRRLRLGDTTILAAQLVRRVNQEANPAEERTFVIAEGVGQSKFTTVHGVRSEGTEETAAHFDLIGAFRSGAALYLVISTDSPAGSTIEILERKGGAWRVRWTRSIAC